MVFKKGEINNPKGNPGLRDARKTGPVTLEGKFNSVLSSGSLIHGNQSKLLKKIRQCAICPLGKKTQQTKVNGKKYEKTIPAKCEFWMTPETKNGTECVLPVADFIRESKIYYDIGREQDTMALQEAVTQQVIRDAIVSRDVEMLKGGIPGFYTKEFTELAIKSLEGINKIKYSQANQHQHIHLENDVAKKIIDRMLGEKDEETKTDG